MMITSNQLRSGMSGPAMATMPVHINTTVAGACRPPLTVTVNQPMVDHHNDMYMLSPRHTMMPTSADATTTYAPVGGTMFSPVSATTPVLHAANNPVAINDNAAGLGVSNDANVVTTLTMLSPPSAPNTVLATMPNTTPASGVKRTYHEHCAPVQTTSEQPVPSSTTTAITPISPTENSSQSETSQHANKKPHVDGRRAAKVNLDHLPPEEREKRRNFLERNRVGKCFA
jgi:hypothetical protein